MADKSDKLRYDSDKSHPAPRDVILVYGGRDGNQKKRIVAEPRFHIPFQGIRSVRQGTNRHGHRRRPRLVWRDRGHTT